MAEAWLRALAGDRFEAHSAGTTATHLRPEAVAVMAEVGVDLAGQESKSWERYLHQPFDWVITVCDDAAEICPVFPGPARHLHWSISDPSRAGGSPAERLKAFRMARDRLRTHVDAFVREYA